MFDNGIDIGRVDWIRDGAVNALAYSRAAAAEFGAPVAVAADNLVMTGDGTDLADMIAQTERGLLLTTLWYMREVDPTTLLLTGLTRDGVYLVERRRSDRGGQQLPVQREPVGAGAASQPGRRQRADSAAGMGRLGDPHGDASAADSGLSYVIGEPGDIIHLWCCTTN